jgi:type II secretory pathway predicted ATPase ExeA
MYEAFYGLRERPFDLTASPRFLFLTAKHREALSNLQYGVESRKGLTVLLGEAGTGKTTILRAAIELQRGQNVTAVYVNNPTLSRAEFYELLADGFGLGADVAASKPRLLAALERALVKREQQGGVSALMIDEAQSLPHELLEEIRLLSNLESASAKLLPTVLIGQPELADRLNEPSLRQLKQRVALRCTLAPLDLRETAAYIAKRVRVAGGEGGSIFTREAVQEIYQRSGGIPRTINVICDNALVSGFALDRATISQDIVHEVCRDFDLAEGTNDADVPALVLRGDAKPHPVDARADTGSPESETTTAGGGSLAAPPRDEMFAAVGRRRRFSFF